MAFLNLPSEFNELMKDDLANSDLESANDSGSVASDTSENHLMQYEQSEWIENEPHSDEETEEVGDCATVTVSNSEDIKTLKSKEGSIIWLTKPVKSETLRLRNQTGYANCNVNPQTVKGAFELFFNRGLKNVVLTHTNANGLFLYKEKWKMVDVTELDAILGLCVLAGVFKSKGQDVRELWEESIGISRFRATVSFNRFQDVLRCMKFDDAKTREQRKKSDALAPVAEYLEIFGHSCKSNYIPSMEITVGRQLYPWRGKGDSLAAPGLKFWLAADASNSYCINIQLDCYKTKRCSNFAIEITNKLCSHLYNQDRAITFDGLHTDYELSLKLLKQGTYVLGSASSSKAEIPNELLGKKRKIGSCLFGFTNEVTICSYNPRKNSSTILMSTLHSNDSPDIIKDYNRTKSGVCNLDKLLSSYSVRRKSKRWHMVVFYNTLDIACYNALIIWLLLHPEWNLNKQHKRRAFLKQLALELTEPQIQLRARTPTLHRSTKRAIEDSGFSLLKQVGVEDPVGTCKRKRCHICPRSLDRKSQVTCHECNLPVCKEHSNTTVVCRTCLQNEECSENDY